MATDKQIEANRKNSQLSTGPQTPAGLKTSSQNATKRGYTGKSLILTDEEQEPYAAHVRAYTANYGPIDGVEADLLNAVHHHQLHKAKGLPWSPSENGFFRKHFSRSFRFNELQESIHLG